MPTKVMQDSTSGQRESDVSVVAKGIALPKSLQRSETDSPTVILPFLTLSDPAISGEGALDPLGLSSIAERLADQILPGLRARMSRPRFVTAMAVCAHVCADLEDELAKDGVSPPYLVFEWLLVEAFARRGNRELTRGTPGTLKAQEVTRAGSVICARTYLKTPTVFGFHGVYKPLARNLGVTGDDFQLADAGFELLKTWQDEQGLPGFLESSQETGPGTRLRGMLRAAVSDGLRHGHTARLGGWEGWQQLADHLSPGQVGPDEATCLNQLLLDRREGLRAEVFRLLADVDDDVAEAVVVREHLLPRASKELRPALAAIEAFEDVARVVEDAFEWIRYLSTTARGSAVSADDFAGQLATRDLSRALPSAVERAGEALADGNRVAAKLFADLSDAFASVRSPEELFTSVLARHTAVQTAKPPEGKRDWFERSVTGAAMVRVQYQRKDPVEPVGWWNRPYRIGAARSFLRDFDGRL